MFATSFVASIVEYRQAPESKPLRRLWLILDGLSRPRPAARAATLSRDVLARPIQFSKNRPDPQEVTGLRTPVVARPRSHRTETTVFRGTFQFYYSHYWPSTPGRDSPRQRRQPPTLVSRIPSVVVSGLVAREARGLGTSANLNNRLALTNRRRRTFILRAEGGCVNPYRPPLLENHLTTLSGGAEPRRACPFSNCLTYGRPIGTRTHQ